MYQQATQAYQKAATTTTDPRELEAEMLMKAAAKLSVLLNNGDNLSEEQRNEILTFNRTAWTILATEATAEDNPLPIEVKTNIGNLAIFTFNETIALLAGQETDTLETLININKAIAAGLRGQTA